MIKQLTISLFLTICVYNAVAQTIQVSGDTSLCFGASVTLQVDTTSTSANPINYYLSDDSHSGIIEIGFDFPYYDSTYNRVLIASNGYLTFDLSYANGDSEWNAQVDHPDSLWYIINNQPANRIMFPWADWRLDSNGAIRSLLCGQYPNRKFIITFDKIKIFGYNSGECVFQVVLNESTGIIEMNILKLPIWFNWDQGRATQGIVDRTGAVGHIIDGRNYSDIWTNPEVIRYDSHRFTPDSSGGYTIDSIPFSYINSVDKIYWNGNFREDLIRDVDPDSSMWFVIDMKYACGIQELVGSELVGGNVSDSIFLTVHNCASVEEGNEHHFKVFPNPTHNNITLDFFQQVRDARLNVYDAMGKLVSSEQLDAVTKFDVSLPEATGIYFVQALFMDGTHRTVKVLKE